MPTHTFTQKWNDLYGATLSKSKDLADTGELRIDPVIEDTSEGAQVACSIIAAKTTGLYLVSNADLTLKINGANEVVLITPASATAGDTFKLIFGGQQTNTIPFVSGTAAQVQAAMEALSTVGAGNITASGVAGGPWTLTFVKALGLTNVGAITVGTIATVSGATITPTVTVSGVAAAQTLTMLAGIPLMWFTGCNLAYPFLADVVNFFVSNHSGQQATLNVRTLYHP